MKNDTEFVLKNQPPTEYEHAWHSLVKKKLISTTVENIFVTIMKTEINFYIKLVI